MVRVLGLGDAAVSSNSAPNEAIAPVYTITGDDLAFYDRLPPEFRRFMQELPIEAAARPVFDALREHDAVDVAAFLVRNRQQVIERLRQEMAEALAK